MRSIISLVLVLNLVMGSPLPSPGRGKSVIPYERKSFDQWSGGSAFDEIFYHTDASQGTKNLLKSFTSVLVNFSNQTDFDVPRFQASLPCLKGMVSDIEFWASKAKLSHELNLLHDFALNMFEYLKTSSKDILAFCSTTSPGADVFYQIIVLNTRIFSLFHPTTYPTLSYFEYEKILVFFKNQVSFWAREFSRLPNVPTDMRLKFEDQVTQATETLELLEEHNPRFFVEPQYNF